RLPLIRTATATATATAKACATSGRRGSNPRHQAWKACALPTELLPRPPKMVGEGFEPSKAYAGRFTVCSRWPLGYPTVSYHAKSRTDVSSKRADGET